MGKAAKRGRQSPQSTLRKTCNTVLYRSALAPTLKAELIEICKSVDTLEATVKVAEKVLSITSLSTEDKGEILKALLNARSEKPEIVAQ